jgi:hypothetical protein
MKSVNNIGIYGSLDLIKSNGYLKSKIYKNEI